MPVETVLNIFAPIGRPDGITVADVRAALDRAGKRPLTVLLHSPGGSGFEALAIHSLLASHPAGVEVRIVGVAASAATVLAMAARPGGLSIVENGMMLLHDPHLEVDGRASDHDTAADLLRKVGAEFRSIYAKRSGLAPERVQQLLDRETWLTAAEAKALNLVDQVLPAARVAASWEPSKFFKNPPALFAKETSMTPATVAELRAVCPGAPADFLLGLAEAGADVPTAKAAWLEQREKALDEREAKAAAKPGVKPLASSEGATAPAGDGEGFEDLVQAAMQKGLSRLEAVRHVGRAHRDAHERYVRAHNSDHRKIQALIGERFSL